MSDLTLVGDKVEYLLLVLKGQDQKEVVRVYPDGRTVYSGTPDQASQAFWAEMEKAVPAVRGEREAKLLALLKRALPYVERFAREYETVMDVGTSEHHTLAADIQRARDQ